MACKFGCDAILAIVHPALSNMPRDRPNISQITALEVVDIDITNAGYEHFGSNRHNLGIMFQLERQLAL
jgi:hypothetical protein